MESAFGMMGLPWMMMGFALLVVLALTVLFAAGAGRGKRKNDGGAQKPKREPRYIVADDGELLEVTDDETPRQEKEKRRAAQ